MAANNKNIKLCEKFQSIMIDHAEDLSEGQLVIIIKMIEQLKKSEPNDKKNVCESSEGDAACAVADAGAGAAKNVCESIEGGAACAVAGPGAGAACAISELPTKDVSSESEANIMLASVVKGFFPTADSELDFSNTPPIEKVTNKDVLETPPKVNGFSQLSWGERTLDAILNSCPGLDGQPSAVSSDFVLPPPESFVPPPSAELIPPPSIITVYESDNIVNRRQKVENPASVIYIPPEEDEIEADAQLLEYSDQELEDEAGPSGLQSKGEKEKGAFGK